MDLKAQGQSNNCLQLAPRLPMQARTTANSNGPNHQETTAGTGTTAQTAHFAPELGARRNG
jgi:hypothetical protein